MNCPVCKSNNIKTIVENCKDQYYNIDGTFEVSKCKKCEFVFTLPYLTGKELFKYYPDNYADYNENINYKHRINRFSLRFIRNLLLPNSSYYVPENIKDNANILEIGCSHGRFLNYLKELNSKTDLLGIELNEKAASIARKRGFDIINQPFEDINFNKKFNYVFMWMVLEHISYPQQVLKKLSLITENGAEIIFSVPNINSFEFDIFKKYAQHLEIPRHVNHFTLQFLKKIFNDHGFKYISHQNIYEPITFFKSLSIFLANKLGQDSKIAGFFGKYEYAPFNDIKGKILLYSFGYLIMLIQRLFSKTPRVIYIFKKIN